ncbi:MAG: vitamin K epoxide reductase family protein, partial [Patulibacter sp.]
LGCAIYLTYTKIAHGGQCLVSGCSVVQQSRWSEMLGIPVTWFGVAGYVAILGLLSLRGETARLLLVVVSGVGFLFSMYMMYRAYGTLHAFCPFCTASAAMMTLLFLVSATRFVLGPDGGPPSALVGLDADEDEDLLTA